MNAYFERAAVVSRLFAVRRGMIYRVIARNAWSNDFFDRAFCQLCSPPSTLIKYYSVGIIFRTLKMSEVR